MCSSDLLRFPGQYFDEETDLHYNWNRYYDPESGRYSQTDLIGFEGGDVNLYRYVNNNPINLIDTDGLILRPLGKYLFKSIGKKIGKKIAGDDNIEEGAKMEKEFLHDMYFMIFQKCYSSCDDYYPCYNDERRDKCIINCQNEFLKNMERVNSQYPEIQ